MVGGRGETYVYVYLCLPHHGERVVVVILFDQDLVLLGHVSEKRYVALLAVQHNKIICSGVRKL